VFFPPRPMYSLEDRKDPNTGADQQVMWIMDEKGERIQDSGFANKNFRVQFIQTARKQTIPLMMITYPGAKATILFSHGNATDIGCMRDHLIDMAVKLQVSVYCYDYSGYGLSTGKPSIKNVMADADAVMKFMNDDKKIPPEQIIVYGQSLGSGPSLHLAMGFPVLGVVLHSGMMSGLRVIRDVKKSHWFDIFPNIDNIKKVKAPVFVIHGKQDEEIPIHHGEGLFDASPNKYEPWYVDNAGHNNIELHWRQDYFAKLGAFVKSLEKRKS